jgi:hypothetical protein
LFWLFYDGGTMSNLSKYLAFVAGLSRARPQLRTLMGGQWRDFDQRLKSLLNQISTASNEAELLPLMTTLVNLAKGTPAEAAFKALAEQAGLSSRNEAPADQSKADKSKADKTEQALALRDFQAQVQQLGESNRGGSFGSINADDGFSAPEDTISRDLDDLPSDHEASDSDSEIIWKEAEERPGRGPMRGLDLDDEILSEPENRKRSMAQPEMPPPQPAPIIKPATPAPATPAARAETASESVPPPPPQSRPRAEIALESSDSKPAVAKTERQVNVAFFRGGEQYEADKPLGLDHNDYRLGMNIGAPWVKKALFATFAATVVEQVFKKKKSITLTVAVRSFEKVSFSQTSHKLELKEAGDTEKIYFPFKLSADATGRRHISLDLLYEGHLLQSFRIDFEVLNRASDTPNQSAFPLQRIQQSWVRATALGPDSLAGLAQDKRALLLVLERRNEQLGLQTYQNGKAEDFQEHRLADAGLTNMVASIRALLWDMVKDYQGGVGGPDSKLAAHLGKLAEKGSNFYSSMFPNWAERYDTQLNLPAGSTMQIAPLSKNLSLPWEAIYDRPIESYSDSIKLCPDFRKHGPDQHDCPHYGDYTYVCPHGFWGYRYLIEQLPCRIEAGGQAHGLPTFVQNQLPLQWHSFLYMGADFKQREVHFKKLAAATGKFNLKLSQYPDKASIRGAFAANPPTPADILYFYTHGITEKDGAKYFKVGLDEYLGITDFNAWLRRTDYLRNNPLVFLNACESVGQSPDDFEDILRKLCEKGAAGVIGTQCSILELLADAVAIGFAERFLAGASAGQALHDTRLALLLAPNPDPRPLVYSLFAAAEVRLGQAIKR